MTDKKANIVLEKINFRIDMGEFDNSLGVPFASRKLLKALIKSKMIKKVETNATPILSEVNIAECIKDVRETAAFTVAVFIESGIMEKVGNEYKVTDKWEKMLNPK